VNVNRARIIIQIVDLYFQCAYVDCKIFNVSVARVQLDINVKTHFRVLFTFVKQVKIAVTEAQRDRYEEISSKLLYNNDVEILNVVIDQQKNYRAHSFILNVILYYDQCKNAIFCE
jgi:hypothetical protein